MTETTLSKDEMLKFVELQTAIQAKYKSIENASIDEIIEGLDAISELFAQADEILKTGEVSDGISFDNE